MTAIHRPDKLKDEPKYLLTLFLRHLCWCGKVPTRFAAAYILGKSQVMLDLRKITSSSLRPVRNFKRTRWKSTRFRTDRRIWSTDLDLELVEISQEPLRITAEKWVHGERSWRAIETPPTYRLTKWSTRSRCLALTENSKWRKEWMPNIGH